MRFIRFIVSLLANVMNILVSLIIILLNVYVSWNHTLELFHEAGFTREGYMDIAGVCAVELTFLLGSCHVIGARVKGRKPGWGSILTGALGVGLIMWSNIRAGVDYGITGVIIGIAVPLSIILCETILADAWRSQVEEQEKEQPVLAQDAQKPDPIAQAQETVTADQEPAQKLKPVPQPAHSQTAHNDALSAVSDEDRSGELVELTKSPEYEPITQEMYKEIYNKANITIDAHKDTYITEELPNNEPHNDTQHTKEEADNSQERTHESTKELLTDEEEIRTIAEREKEKTGDYPSIRELARIAPCKEWRARRVLRELRTQIS